MATLTGSTGSTTLVLVVVLIALGAAMVMTAVWLVRSTRSDAPALGPLEVMSARRWGRGDADRRAAQLTGARPAGALPPAPMVPFDADPEPAAPPGDEPESEAAPAPEAEGSPEPAPAEAPDALAEQHIDAEHDRHSDAASEALPDSQPDFQRAEADPVAGADGAGEHEQQPASTTHTES